MKKLSQEEAAKVLEDMKVKIEIPKAAVTQWKRNTALDMAIEALSSSEFPNNSDAISRQAAIDTLENTKTAISENGERYIAKQNAIMRIDALPSVQPEPSQVAKDIARIVENEQDMRILPKRGKWILDRSGAYCCSECMEPCAGYVMMKPRDKFCKMCGSRNEVTE